MALINCAECGKQMSDQVSACPNCGHPNPVFEAPKAAAETADEQKARIKAHIKARQQARLMATSKKEGDEIHEKKTGRLVGCLSLIIFVFILGPIFSLSLIRDKTPSSSPSKKSTSQVDNSWVPDGFVRYDNKVAINWSLPDTCRSYSLCINLEVVPRNGCDSLYAEASELDVNGNNIGYTNDSTSFVKAGQKAILKFQTWDDDVRDFDLAEISCR